MQGSLFLIIIQSRDKNANIIYFNSMFAIKVNI